MIVFVIIPSTSGKGISNINVYLLPSGGGYCWSGVARRKDDNGMVVYNWIIFKQKENARKVEDDELFRMRKLN